MTTNTTELKLPGLSARQLAMATLVVGMVLLGFWLLFRFYQVLLVLLAGIIVSLALEPAVKRLKARGVPPGVAVGLIYGLMLIVGILFLRFGVPLIASQSATISAQLSEGYTSIVGSLKATPNLLIQRVVESLPEQLSMPAAQPTGAAAEEGATPWADIFRYSGQAAKAIFQIGTIFLIAFFWTIESDRIKRSGVALLPLNKREPARELIAEIEQRVGSYVLGQLLLSVIMGALSLVAYLIIGLPYAPLLALFVGIMEIIPLIGPLIGAIPALVIGFSISPLTAVWTIVASLIIHQLESNVFGPRVMKRTLGMRPLVTLLALTAFGTLFGVLGAIVALPLASVLQLFFDRFLVGAQSRSDGGTERDLIGVLRYEVQELVEDVRKMIRRREGEALEDGDDSATVEDTLEAIAQDLDSLLAKLREPEAAL
jgi:predicted PurR-regulated permease PerM